MPLNFYNENEDKHGDHGDTPEERQMTAEEIQALIAGDIDPTDDEQVAKMMGTKGLEGVLKIEKMHAELVAGMRQMLEAREKKDPATPMYVFMFTSKMREAIKSLDEKEVLSLLGIGLTQQVLLENLITGVLNEDDEDDD